MLLLRASTHCLCVARTRLQRVEVPRQRELDRTIRRQSHGTATVAQVSSTLGSLTSNTSEMEQFFSSCYGYSMSKAALNMVTRSLAVGLKGNNIVFVTLNPGYVDTDMNDHQGVLRPSDVAKSLADTVANVAMKDTGKFYNADKTVGEFELPW